MHIVDTAPTATAPPSQPEPWVDIATVMRHLGFSRGLVAQMAKEGKIPGVPHRNGRRTYWRFKLSAVDAALESGGRL